MDCVVCDKLLGESVIYLRKQAYHPGCFKCSVCKISLADKQCSMQQGKVLCTTCGLPKCFRCDLGVEEGGLMALDKVWHVECFVCLRCGDDFSSTGQFVAVNSEPFCVTCGEIRKSKKFNKKKREVITPNKQACFSCEQMFDKDDEIVVALNSWYHDRCFTCTKCDIRLQPNSFIALGDQPVCIECSSKLFSKVCNSCGKEITGNIVLALKQSWHPNCLTCIHCNQSIINLERVYHQDNQPCCPNCMKTVFKPKFRPASDKVIPKQHIGTITLEDILSNNEWTDIFLQYLIEEYSIEPLMFYIDVTQFISVFMTRDDMKSYSKRIFVKYLQRDAELEVPVSFQIKQQIYRTLDSPSREMFEPAIQEMLTLLKTSYFSKFLTSKHFYKVQKATSHLIDIDMVSHNTI